MSDRNIHTFDRYLAPIVFEDRYFVMEQREHEMLVTVIRKKENTVVFEMFRNLSMETDDTHMIATSPNTLTVRHRTTDTPLYSVSGTKITLCGLLYGDFDILVDEVGVRIGDSTYTHDEFDIQRGGIEVFDDGRVGLGKPLPSRVLELLEAVSTLLATEAVT
ncbi:MAG TPA: hypothetical protein VKB81_07360 [Nitrospira sp.]|nr:hypothetical protein [Nitrospira sp.]